MVPVRLAFAVFGAFWGTWAVAALDVQEFLGFSEQGLGVLVAATVAGTVVTNIVGGTLAERRGPQRATAVALWLWGPLVLAVALVPIPWLWVPAFLAVVAAGGMLDVVVNVAAASALADRPGRLLRAHAAYNTGALLGAAAAGGAVSAWAWGWRLPWSVCGAAALALAAALDRRPGWMAATTSGEHVRLRDAVGELRRSGLLPLAVVFLLGATVEGGVGTFGVLYLRDRLDIAVLAGAGAYVVGQALATVARAALGASDARLGGTRAAKGGLLLAGVGLVLEAATDLPAVAAAGLAIASIGAATYWPLLSAVANGASDRPALAVGGVSAAGYLGFLAGPVAVGVVANGVDLRAGILLLALAGIGGASVSLRSLGRPAVTASGSGGGIEPEGAAVGDR